MKLAILGGGGFRVPLVYEAVASNALAAEGRTAVRLDEVVLHDSSTERLEAMRRILDEDARRFPDPPDQHPQGQGHHQFNQAKAESSRRRNKLSASRRRRKAACGMLRNLGHIWASTDIFCALLPPARVSSQNTVILQLVALASSQPDICPQEPAPMVVCRALTQDALSAPTKPLPDGTVQVLTML